jgi:hypothetical protein
VHKHFEKSARLDAGPAFGDERGSVGTGTDERIRQERPTSTGFCIGDRRVVSPVAPVLA